VARVLVIDDDEPIRQLLRLTFEHAGHQVLLAEDGFRGTNLARREHPDVIVLDVMMPVMDGATAMHELHANEETKGIPILVLTAVTLTKVAVGLLRSGAARVMTKPFDPAQVVEAAEDLVFAFQPEASTPTA
jgi:two-component system, OmpR family, alkaline phosphatase synthesis response regulator PhoP